MPHGARFPLYGWLAVLWLIGAEALMFLRQEPFVTWFTPIQWTGYILFLDALLVRLGRRSYIFAQPRLLAYMAIVSIAVWYLFEGYNLHLQNWKYIHLPHQYWKRLLGYFWAFATILPGVLLTSEAIDSLGIFSRVRVPRVRMSPGLWRSFVVFGVLSVSIPLLVPSAVARYLFAFVWVGYVFLLDPINYRFKRPSLLGQLETGRIDKLLSLFLSGGICGFLWEFWNYWATAKWIYTVPILGDVKIFEMPVVGYLGFPPFAVEIFVMWETVKHVMRLD